MSLLLALFLLAESYPPGDYSEVGVVILDQRGHPDLFDGYHQPLSLTDKLANQLKPHVGKMVRVDYTRVERDSVGANELIWDSSGAPIGKIRGISAVPARALRVTVRIADARIPQANAIPIEVTIRGGRDDQTVDLGKIWITLLPSRTTLHPKSELVVVPGGGEFRRTFHTDRMQAPGRYVVRAAIEPGEPNVVISNAAPIEVLKPKDGAEEKKALRAWLLQAPPDQQIVIAERLAALGDSVGVPVVLRMLEDSVPVPGNTNFLLHRFAWKHGGEEQMFARLKKATRQYAAADIILALEPSPKARPIVIKLLKNQRVLGRDDTNWCKHPRICDLAAERILSATKSHKFPKAGTAAERDAVIATILTGLRQPVSR
jgi:hypothetical protein